MTEQTTEIPTTDPETSDALPNESVSGPLVEEDVPGTVTPGQPDDETFPRSYVQRLRDESAKHRQRAADRDTLAERLHGSLVAATGRLADPSDLAFDDAHLTDPDVLAAAIDDLLTRKPHLASRRVVGDVGQGATGGDASVDLARMLRQRC